MSWMHDAYSCIHPAELHNGRHTNHESRHININVRACIQSSLISKSVYFLYSVNLLNKAPFLHGAKESCHPPSPMITMHEHDAHICPCIDYQMLSQMYDIIITHSYLRATLEMAWSEVIE